MNDSFKKPETNPLLSLLGSGLTHVDQTTKQPVVFRCPNPACKELGKFFDFISSYPECPKCGLGPPGVQKRVLIHFLYPDPTGPVIGYMGLSSRMACDPPREVLATHTNGEAATDTPGEVNCPGCMKSKVFQAIIKNKLRNFRRGAKP